MDIDDHLMDTCVTRTQFETNNSIPPEVKESKIKTLKIRYNELLDIRYRLKHLLG